MCGVQTSTLDIYDLAKFADLFEQERNDRQAFLEDNRECITRLRSFFGKELCEVNSDTILPTEAGYELIQIAMDVRESLDKISKLDQFLAQTDQQEPVRALELA